MAEYKVYCGHLMLCFFRNGKNAPQAAKKVCAVYGEDVDERTVYAVHYRRYLIETEIESNPRSKLHQLTGMLNKSKSTIYGYIVKFVYVNRLDVWVPHDLTGKNLFASPSATCFTSAARRH